LTIPIIRKLRGKDNLIETQKRVEKQETIGTIVNIERIKTIEITDRGIFLMKEGMKKWVKSTEAIRTIELIRVIDNQKGEEMKIKNTSHKLKKSTTRVMETPITRF
jgi:hypothetical protein